VIATDAEIRSALEPALGPIERLDRRPYVYASSYPLEAIDAVRGDGSVVPLLFKDLSPPALSPAGRAAKPAFLLDPRREIAVYRDFLARRGRGTARCYAVVSDPTKDRYWLFLERVTGREMYQVGEFDHWLAAARWLARLHASGAVEGCHLIRHDEEYYRRWPRLAGLDLPGYDAVIRRLAELPATLIHGEFYASNVLVQETPSGVRICPVDWETAGVGPGLIDLAALTTGRWSNAERAAMIAAYRAALAAEGQRPPPLEELLVQLDWCRLHLALRWLYRPAGWRPPAHQAFDWRGEVEQVAAKLRLGGSVR
jgi:hypothetical protein